MELHKVRIQSGSVGLMTQTTIDGRPFHGIRDIRVHFGMEEPNTVDIEFITEAMDMEFDAEVRYKIAFMHPETRQATFGSGATPEEALEDVLRQLKVAV